MKDSNNSARKVFSILVGLYRYSIDVEIIKDEIKVRYYREEVYNPVPDEFKNEEDFMTSLQAELLFNNFRIYK